MVWFGALLLGAGSCWALVKEAPTVTPTPVAAAAEPEVQDAAVRAAAQQVATDYLAALNAGGIGAGIAFLHPDELVRFKQQMVPILEQEGQAGRRTLLNATFGRRAGMMDARIAGPDDFMRRFARVAAARLDQVPIRFDRVDVIGSVSEGDVMHVLAREIRAQGGVETQRLVVVSLRRSASDWKVLLGNDVEDLVISLQGPSGRRQPLDRRDWQEPDAPFLNEGTESTPGAGPLR